MLIEGGSSASVQGGPRSLGVPHLRQVSVFLVFVSSTLVKETCGSVRTLFSQDLNIRTRVRLPVSHFTAFKGVEMMSCSLANIDSSPTGGLPREEDDNRDLEVEDGVVSRPRGPEEKKNAAPEKLAV